MRAWSLCKWIFGLERLINTFYYFFKKIRNLGMFCRSLLAVMLRASDSQLMGSNM